MATLVGTLNDFKKDIRRLLELGYDANETYQVAIERLQSSAYQQKMREFLTDHDRHVSDLLDLAIKHGIEAPKGSGLKPLLTKGRVINAKLMGDKAILTAMKTNEDHTVKAYDRLSDATDTPPDFREVLVRGLADKERHRRWMNTETRERRKAT